MPDTIHKPLVLIDGIVTRLPDGDKIAGAGNMEEEVYDPLGIKADAFDRANHHGTQDVSTITGLGGAALLDIGTGPDDVAAGDHAHVCCGGDMLSEIYDPQGIEDDCFARENHTGVQLLETISDAGEAAAYDVGMGEGILVAPGDHDHNDMYMRKEVYDPTGYGFDPPADIFDRANHTGTQSHETIDGLGEAALLDVGEGSDQVAAGDHDHSDIYMEKSIYNPQEIEADVFARENHTGTQTLSTISDADMEGASSTKSGKKGVVPAPSAGQQTFYLRGDGFWTDPATIPGIMLQVDYDTNGDGVVDDAEKLNGEEPAFYLDRANHTGTQDVSTITGLDAVYQRIDEKGQPNGYPELDADGWVPLEQLPDFIVAGLKFIGTWNADMNVTSPDNVVIPAAAEENKGHYYRVSHAGSTEVDGESDWKPGDWIVSDGTTWTKADNTDVVTSVAGKTGDVDLVLSDLSDVDTTGALDTQLLGYNGASWGPVDAPTGDMEKAVYDISNTGVVDNAEMLGGEDPAFYLDRANHTGTQDVSTITGLDAVYERKENKGQADGYPDLDADGKVPPEQLPDTVAAGLTFAGTWDAASALPAADSSNNGSYYRVSADGTYNLDGITDWKIGDWAVSEGTAWTKADNSSKITSVVGKEGDVTIDLNDLSDVSAAAPNTDDVLVYSGGSWTTAAISGDMTKAVYDTNNSGVVDDADKLNNQLPSYYLDLANATGTLAVAQITGLGDGATANFGVGTNDIARGDHTHATMGDMFKANNLSDLTNFSTARSNLGLTEAIVTASFGTAAGDVAEGDHEHLLDDLTDADTTTVAPVDGNFLRFDGANWVPSAPDVALNDLSDVDTTDITDGQVIAYDAISGNWIPSAQAAQELDDLTDVDTSTTAPLDGETLIFTSGTWVPGEAGSGQAELNMENISRNKIYTIARMYASRFGDEQNIDEFYDQNGISSASVFTYELSSFSYDTAATLPDYEQTLTPAEYEGDAVRIADQPLSREGSGFIYYPQEAGSLVGIEVLLKRGGADDLTSPHVRDVLWYNASGSFGTVYPRYNLHNATDAVASDLTDLTQISTDWGWYSWSFSPVSLVSGSALGYILYGGADLQTRELYIGRGSVGDIFPDSRSSRYKGTIYTDQAYFETPFRLHYGAPDGTLTSASFTASASPNNAYLAFELVSTLTYALDTQVKGWASRDGGTTWLQIPLQYEIDYGTGNFVIYGDATFTTEPSGTDMQYRITSHSAGAMSVTRTVFGWGSDSVSYWNVEETRTAPIHFDSHSEQYTDHGNLSGTVTMDYADSNIHRMTITGDTTVSVANMVAGRATALTAIITNGGSATITWPTVTWVSGGGSAPSLQATGTDIVTLISLDGGTTLYGTYVR